MPRFKSMVLLGLVITVITSLSLMAVYLLFSNNYEEFITWFLTRIHKLHLLKTASSFLSQQQFILLRVVAILLSATVLCLLVVAYKKRTALLARTTSLIEQLESAFIGFINNLPPTGKMQRGLFFFLIGFYIIRTTFSIIYYPIDFDEADTYMLFSSQGPLVSATFYPLPNNHILFSIITSITSLLPIDPVYALRLPLLVIGLLCMIMMYAMLKKQFSVETALIGLSFFISLYPLFLYSFLARGYLLFLFFYLLSLYAVLRLCIAKEDRKRYYYLFTIASIAGLYTIPSFLYGLTGLFLFASISLILQKRNAAFIRLFKSGIIIAVVTTALYLPVLISANWELLNPYLIPVYIKAETIGVFKTTYTILAQTFLSPNHLIAAIIAGVLLIGSVFLFLSKSPSNRSIVLFAWLQLALSLFVFFAFKQLFPAKPWMHFTVVVVLLFAAIVHLLIKRKGMHPFILAIVSLLFISSGTIISYTYKKDSTVSTGYNSVAEKCEKLMLENNVKEIYTEVPYFKTMIDYYAIKNHLEISIYNSRKASQLYAAFDPQKKYDLIIAYADRSKLPPSLNSYDTVLRQYNVVVLMIRQ